MDLSKSGVGTGTLVCLLIGAAVPLPGAVADRRSPTRKAYPWLEAAARTQPVAQRFPPPPGFERTAVSQGGFAHWLRHLPLRPGRPPVRLFSGDRAPVQSAHAAVIALDVGDRNLQQCADAVIRLRAEYLWARGHTDRIGFHFTSGDFAPWPRWARGHRPRVDGNAVRWVRTARPDRSYDNFRAYLRRVFVYAGTHSLGRELVPVGDPRDVRPGDVFVEGGFPGHAVLVVDVAERPDRPGKLMLLAQSYMPAREMHVLRNPNDTERSPWYRGDFEASLRTPQWTFEGHDLRRFE